MSFHIRDTWMLAYDIIILPLLPISVCSCFINNIYYTKWARFHGQLPWKLRFQTQLAPSFTLVNKNSTWNRVPSFACWCSISEAQVLPHAWNLCSNCFDGLSQFNSIQSPHEEHRKFTKCFHRTVFQANFLTLFHIFPYLANSCLFSSKCYSVFPFLCYP